MHARTPFLSFLNAIRGPKPHCEGVPAPASALIIAPPPPTPAPASSPLPTYQPWR